jgi:hypothetical protein
MQLAAFVRCLLGRGHVWKNSRRKPGHMTCERCGARRKY